MAEYNHQGFRLLYVDDEPQALKMFEIAYRDSFPILTAASAPEGWKLIQDMSDQIGVLITDQRMPGETGVSLMQKVQAEYPHIVRILTTAYSDLDCAINAVNLGGAFAYVTKPWEIDGLHGVLKRAMEFFIIRWERNRLLHEKAGSLQRMLVMDRVRGLVTLAAALSGTYRNTLNAVASYVEQANLAGVLQRQKEDLYSLDLIKAAREECETIVFAAQRIANEFKTGDYSGNCPTSLSETINEYIQINRDAKSADGVQLTTLSSDSNVRCFGNKNLLLRLIDLLVSRIGDMDGEDRIVTINAEPASPSKAKITLAVDSPEWKRDQVSSLYSAAIPLHDWPMGLDMDILSVFFIAHHYGGGVKVLDASPVGPGFCVELNVDDTDDSSREVTREWLDDVFRHVELWRNIV